MIFSFLQDSQDAMKDDGLDPPIERPSQRGFFLPNSRLIESLVFDNLWNIVSGT